MVHLVLTVFAIHRPGLGPLSAKESKPILVHKHLAAAVGGGVAPNISNIADRSCASDNRQQSIHRRSRREVRKGD